MTQSSNRKIAAQKIKPAVSAPSPEKSGRRLNWLETTSRSLRTRLPILGNHQSSYITERLAALLLQRLPPDVSVSLYDLLPDYASGEFTSLATWSNCEETTSIGYPDFIERAAHAIGTALPERFDGESQSHLDLLASQIVDNFLWSVTWEIPADLKSRMRELLPTELSSRMNLSTSTAEESRVA